MSGRWTQRCRCGRGLARRGSWPSPLLQLVAACALLACAPALRGAEPRRYALVVGSNRAPVDTMQPLQYADDDAVRTFQLLEAYTDGAVLLTVMDLATQGRHPRYVDRALPPTAAELRRSLRALFTEIAAARRQGHETELFFVYSGHGRLLPGKEGAITLQDRMLSRSDLYRMVISRSPADYNHLIIDACNAYYLLNTRGEASGWRPDKTGRPRAAAVAAFFEAEDLSRYPNTGVILSTSSEAETHEWSLYQGGVFSHQIRSALLGAADTNEDLYVEYSELQAFVQAANHQVKDARAKLEVFVSPPARARRRPLIDVAAVRSGALLTIPTEVQGRFYIEDDLGTRYADLNKTDEQSVTLSYFLRAQARGSELLVELADRRHHVLDASAARPMSVAARGAAVESFKRDLFAQPFGYSFYLGTVSALGELPAERPGEARRAIAQLDPAAERPSWRLPVATGLFMGGTAALAGGAVTALFALQRSQRYEEAIFNDADLQTEAIALSALSVGLCAAAAALAGAGVFVLLSDDDDPEPAEGP